MDTPDTSARRRIELGQPISAADGPLGEVLDLVIHPIRATVTHLVVGPSRHHEDARLLPIDTVTASDDGALTTSLARDQVEALPRVEERDFFRWTEWPEGDDEWDIGIADVLALPYHAQDFGPAPATEDPRLMGYDRVPVGEVEVRRLSPVIDRHGAPLGHVEAFVIDDEDHITHMVVDRGHFATHRETTVPIGATHRLDNDEVQLDLTKADLAKLPTLRRHRHH